MRTAQAWCDARTATEVPIFATFPRVRSNELFGRSRTALGRVDGNWDGAGRPEPGVRADCGSAAACTIPARLRYAADR